MISDVIDRATHSALQPRLLRALLGLLLGALAVLATGALPADATVTSKRAAAPAAGAAVDAERAIFTGSFVGRPVVEGVGSERTRSYQVEVSEVFGPYDITTERVTVRSRAELESCTDPTQRPGPGDRTGREPSDTAKPDPTSSETPTDGATEPTTPATPIDRQLRLFDATVQDGIYVITDCKDVVLASDTVLTQIVRQFGEGRPVGGETPPASEPLADVGFLCPDTMDALDIDDDRTCPTLEPSQSFKRAAAPGLALVIVGLLGLVLVRRLGRRT